MSSTLTTWLGGRSVTGGERVAQVLQGVGVDVVFSVPGSQVLPIWDGLSRCDGVRLIVPRSERSAAFMAEGYGRISGFPALLLSTLGPGVANEAIGVLSARQAHTPVLCIAPWQPVSKRGRIREVFQGLDHVSFFRQLSPGGRVVDRSEELEATVEAGLDACLAAPGPVRVDISFPLLFGSQHRPPHEATSRRLTGAPGRGPILVSEVPESREGKLVVETLSTAGGPSPLSVEPGIGAAGFGLPFSLGVRCARRGGRIILATTLPHLLANLDSLYVSTRYQLPIHVLVFGGEAGPLHRIAEAFGVEAVTGRRGVSEAVELLDRFPRRSSTALVAVSA